jgi:hypothetical protein
MYFFLEKTFFFLHYQILFYDYYDLKIQLINY